MKKSHERFYPLVIVVFAFVLYANSIPNEYNLDDELVTINHRTTAQGFAGIPEIFSSFYYEDAMGYKYGYRPITHLSFAIEHQFFGDNPQVSHFFNVVLYALLCLLIFYVIKEMFPQKGAVFPLLVSLVFAVHPIHTEVVASIKNRDEILSLLFALSSFLLVLKYFNVKKNWALLFHLGLACMLFQFSLWSKLSSVMLVLCFPVWFILKDNFKKIHSLYFLFIALLTSLITRANWSDRVFFLILCVSFLVVFSIVFHKGFRNKTIEVVNGLLKKKVLLWTTYLFSLLFLFAGAIGGHEILLLFSLVFIVLFLFFTYRIKESIFLSFSSAFLILLSLVYLYNDPYILYIFFVIFALLVLGQPPKTLVVYFAFFTLLGGILAFHDLYLVSVSAIPILFALSKKYFKYLISFWSFLIFVSRAEESTFFVLGLLLFVLVIVYTQLIRLKKIQKLTHLFSAIFLLFIVTVVCFHFTMPTYDRLSMLEVDLEQLQDPIHEELQKFSSIDRPIRFVENPLINHWDLKHRSKATFITSSFYFKKMIVPYPLCFYYGYDTIGILESGLTFWIALGICFVLVCLMFYLLLKGNYLLGFGLFFTLANLFPYANFVTPVAGIVGERLTFTASFGFCLILGLIIYYLTSLPRLKIVSKSIVVILFIVASSLSLYRSQQWKNRLTLFQEDIIHLERSAQANALLAYAIMEGSNNSDVTQEKANLAILFFENALKIDDGFMNWWYDLGRVNWMVGNLDEAENCFENALKIDSNYVSNYDQLLLIAKEKKDLPKVVLYSEKILSKESRDLAFLFDYSTALYFTEQYSKVIKVNQEIISRNPQIPEAFLNIAYAYAQLSEKEMALQYVELGRKLDQEHADIPQILKIIDNI